MSANGVSNGLNDQDFPALISEPKTQSVKKFDALLPTYQPPKVTEVIEIPFEQRRYQNDDSHMWGQQCDTQAKICRYIVKETGVDINLNTTKSNMLTIILSGQPSKVAKAKRSIISELQQQESIKVKVPPEYHGFLIGRRGERLHELEASTMTHITIPSATSQDPTAITISGPKQGVADAGQLILDMVERQSQQGYERLDIPRIYHPFIYGANNQIIDELRDRTGTKINVPPPGSQGTIISISGKRDAVTTVTNEIQALYEKAKQSKTIPVRVQKSQHRLVLGPRGAGLAEVFAQTGVSVELPSDPNSEELILRGQPENLGRALSLVYERAESSTLEEVTARNRLHKLLIGKRGAALNELRKGYERVRIAFGENQDKICVEGPPEEVAVVVDRLNTRVAELEATMAMDTIRVDPKYFRHIIGRQGSNIDRVKQDRGVQIRLPTVGRTGSNTLESNEILIEGDPEGVARTKEEIEQMVAKLQNEKCKDMIIEPKIQQLLCHGSGNSPAPVFNIYSAFPKVSISWSPSIRSAEENARDRRFADSQSFPQADDSIVQLRGDRQQVDAAAEKLTKLIKIVIEENQEQEIHIFAEFRPHIFGRGSLKIQKLLDETKTRIRYPPTRIGANDSSSNVFTIIGRTENVRQCIQQLEALQKKMANVKEIVLSIPSSLTTKFVGGQTQSLRSIREQCDGVHIRIVQPQQRKLSDKVDVMVLGPSDEVEKAKKLLDKLNARVAQLCSEDLVYADPRLHGHLIGSHGSNISKFRERHNVELLFPDKSICDVNLAREIRIVGPKDAIASAKADLEALIKSYEDELEQSVSVESNLLKDINQYRRTFYVAELDQVRVILPRAAATVKSNRSNVDDATTITPTSPVSVVDIKLVGQKACVEAAVQALHEILSDIRNRVTKEYLLEPQQQNGLERSRFPELERSYRVQIKLGLRNPMENGDLDRKRSTWVLTIIGPSDRVEMVYEEKIKPQLPIWENFPFPSEFRGGLYAPLYPSSTGHNADGGIDDRQSPNERPNKNSSDINKAQELRRKYNVIVTHYGSIDAEHVSLFGTPCQLVLVREELNEWILHCEELKADRIARNYEFSMRVPSRFRQLLIQLRPKLISKYEIGIRFTTIESYTMENMAAPPLPAKVTEDVEQQKQQPSPSKEAASASTELNSGDSAKTAPDREVPEPVLEANVASPADDSTEQMTLVILRGYEEKVDAAKDEMLALVNELSSQVTENLCIPVTVHSQLIGAHGQAVQRVMQEFKVRIEFPGGKNRLPKLDRDTVLVTGKQDNVDQACDYLIGRANDLLERMEADSRHSRSRMFIEELLPSAPTNDTLRA